MINARVGPQIAQPLNVFEVGVRGGNVGEVRGIRKREIVRCTARIGGCHVRLRYPRVLRTTTNIAQSAGARGEYGNLIVVERPGVGADCLTVAVRRCPSGWAKDSLGYDMAPADDRRCVARGDAQFIELLNVRELR